MELSLEAILYYLIVIDVTFAVLGAWTGIGKSAYRKLVGGMSKHLPLTRGWATLYLVLVIWLGYTLSRLGIIGF
jgi:hypothetical protein